jgi:hypothetical protein
MIHTTKIYLVTNCYNDPNKVYIGKTKNNRNSNHKRIFGENIVYVEIDQINSLNRYDWEPLESYWIEQFIQWGFKVLNKNRGGGGPITHSQKTKHKLKIANIGRSKPEGFSEKLSQIKTGIKLSKNHCDKISQGKLGKKQSQSFLDKKYKPILQLDKNNNLIQEFKSIEEASNSNNKFKRSNISCCLTGFSKTAYGYKWIYNINQFT